MLGGERDGQQRQDQPGNRKKPAAVLSSDTPSTPCYFIDYFIRSTYLNIVLRGRVKIPTGGTAREFLLVCLFKPTK